ncbi:MAG: sodium:solute symporter [Chlorobaculum sp.]|nr:sodium:solute symporter [Chlorobaculum sp.]
MQPLDYAIIILFLAGNMLLGLWQGRSNKETSDYFLGGHKLPWFMVMLSIVATETSVLTFVSVPGLAYRGDWSFLQLSFGYIVGRILVSFILLPIYFKQGVTSIYEVIGLRFGPGIQKTASVIFLLTRILGDGIRFLATGVVVQAVTGWPLSVSVLVIGIVTLVYTISGGLKTVVWLDSIQFALYLGGGIVTILFILARLDAPLLDVLAPLLDAGKLRIIDDDPHILTNPLSFVSAFSGGILLSLCSHGVDYMMVQRVLGCDGLGSARKAMIASGVFVLFQFALFLLAGSLIYVFFNGAPLAKDREFTVFIVQSLPAGLKGLLLAGILSAAMSTLASSINSLAASTVTDLMKGRASLNASRFISVAWATVLIVIALAFNENDKAIVMLGLEIASFTYGGLLGLFLLSKSSRQFRSPSLVAGLLASMAVVFLLKFLGLAWSWYIAVSVTLNILTTVGVEAILPGKNSFARK